MSEKFARISSYNHAMARHRDYTSTVAATGLFDRGERVTDEFELRILVHEFLSTHTDAEPRRLTTLTEELVPLQDSFAESCVEGYLPASLSGKLAAKALLHYGSHGNFDDFDDLFEAYRSTTDVMDTGRQIVARSQLGKTLVFDTPQYSDRLSVAPGSTESIHYAQTLRRLMARRALSEPAYVARMVEANLQPIPGFMRKLRTF